MVQSGLNKSSSDNSSSDNSSSDKSPSDRASSVQDSHIASLSGYLRDFVEAPADLLVQILSTMVQDDLANPWQPLLDALHTWLGLGQNTFVGDSFAAIEQELSDWLSSEHSSQVADANLSQSNLANANQPTKHKDHFENSDNILFAIAHNHLTEMFNPNPVGQANIGDDFRIGYQPLAFLQPSYPVASAFISPGSQNKPNFTVQIQTPLSI